MFYEERGWHDGNFPILPFREEISIFPVRKSEAPLAGKPHFTCIELLLDVSALRWNNFLSVLIITRKAHKALKIKEGEKLFWTQL